MRSLIVEDAARVSKRIADALEHGEIPWRIPAFPHNVSTRRPFEGTDPLVLNLSANAHGWSSPWWGTRQAWDAICNTPVTNVQGVRLSDCFVFNLDKTDKRTQPRSLPKSDPDEIFDAIIQNGKVQICYGFDSTCRYIRSEDRIVMPYKLLFAAGPGGLDGFWDTLGHEIFHWTESRMLWNGTYGENELRAEIGSGYLCSLLGVQPLSMRFRRHHDRFVNEWIRRLRADPLFLGKVCDSVCRTVRWLLRIAEGGAAGRKSDCDCTKSSNGNLP